MEKIIVLCVAITLAILAISYAGSPTSRWQRRTI
jgi:hypothetical protein